MTLVKRLVACASCALTAGLLVAGCGDTLGDSCSTDGDCSDGLTCLSPGCIGDLSCQYTCSNDGDCESKAGAGSVCRKPDANCVGYCSAAD